jgi:tRNA modification GTPase
MKLSQFKDDTICAPATPSGRSALAVLRVSGQDSLSILKSLCPKIPIEIRPRQSYLTHIVDSHKNTIDQVLVCFFENEKSYTGEPSFEISCHGSPIVVQKILNQLNLLGARLAEPGEFTFRAFLNNKVDF